MTTTWKLLDRAKDVGSGSWIDLMRAGKAIDPYLIWADQRGLLKANPVRVPILVEVERPLMEVPSGQQGSACPVTQCAPVFGLLEIPAAYKALIDPRENVAVLVSKYVTARASANALQELFRHPEVLRFQLGIPRIEQRAADAAISTASGAGRDRPRVVVGVIDDGLGFAHSQFLGTLDAQGTTVPRLCYLWDQDPGRVTVSPWHEPKDFKYGAELYFEDVRAALAVKSAPDGAPLTHAPYASVDYVPRRADPEQHTTSLADNTLGLRRVPAQTMLRAAHGNSVMSLAGGRLGSIAATLPSELQPPTVAEDSAGAWPLIFVQLPSRTTADTTGGSLGVQVLDGLRYIVSRAESIPEERVDSASPLPCPPLFDIDLSKPPSPVGNGGETFSANRVIVNISYGAIGGPHDGTSMLEEAIVDLVDRRPNTWVVMAAGNAHGSATHARIELVEGGDRKRLTWTVGPDNLLESYLEIWLPDSDNQGQPLDLWQAGALLLELTPPAGLPVCQLTAGQGFMLAGAAKDALPVAGAVFSHRVAQSRRGTMVLLAVARTRAPLAGDPLEAGRPTAPHGDWIIEMKWGSANATPSQRKVVVHAWAERNDQVWGVARRQQSTVVGEDPLPDPTEFFPETIEFCRRNPRHITSDAPRPFQPDTTFGTLSGVRRIQEPIDRRGNAVVVGAYRLADGEVSAYSASGPSRNAPADRGMLPGGGCDSLGNGTPGPIDQSTYFRNQPDIDAPADVGTALRGLRTTGLLDGGVARVGGTSAAAPLVARYLAEQAYRKLPGGSGCGPAAKSIGDEPASTMEKVRRPTPTPTKDDRFRRGQRRLKATPFGS